jgi:hypothetical protein
MIGASFLAVTSWSSIGRSGVSASSWRILWYEWTVLGATRSAQSASQISRKEPTVVSS